MSIRTCGIVLLFAAVTTAASAFAHRAKTALTTIERNPVSGSIEVVHSLHWHDAELGLAESIGVAQLSLTTIESQARLALYVEERFGLADAKTSQVLPLELVGAELSGDYVMIYQELAADLPAGLAVRHDVLRDVFPDQVNQLNLLQDSNVRTLVFSGPDTWKTVIVSDVPVE